MNNQDSTNRIIKEMQQIKTVMQSKIQENLSKDNFIKKMYNNHNIICL